jgi:DNA-binding response OmpR family regulator
MVTNQDEDAVPTNVLLAEDDPEDRLEVRLHLELMGFIVYDTPTSKEAKEIFQQRDFSLVLIHFSINPLQSLELCRWIRASSTVPIIMLTRRGELVDEQMVIAAGADDYVSKPRGKLVDEQMVIAAGADDYVSKPLDSKILSSRILQQLRRGTGQHLPRANILSWGLMKMDLSNHEFTVADKELHLTNTEFQFLQLLMENPQRIFTRNQILEAIGVMKGVGSNQLVDTHASRLRKKIREHGGPDVINVIRSVGFRLVDSSKNPHGAIPHSEEFSTT